MLVANLSAASSSTLNLAFGIDEQGSKERMVKSKLFLLVILYVVFGLIAYFNFGFHHLLTESLRGKSTLNQPTWEKLGEDNQIEIPQDPQDPSTDQ